MQHVLTTTHSDEVSGCTMFSDGTRAFWTEGYGSAVYVIYADGREEITDAGTNHPVIHALMTVAEEFGYQPQRRMTPQEEAEIAAVRGW
jgi:hypothetical protein